MKSFRFLRPTLAFALSTIGILALSVAHASSSAVPTSAGIAAAKRSVSVCSFNIQFLGSSGGRDNAALAELLDPYDIVVVQELVAAPATHQTDMPKSRQNSAAFFREMTSRGFAYVMSESDTGRNGPLNNYSTATEWWVTFYRQSAVRPIDDVPHGFISAPLARNRDFDRVPYAFAFRTNDRNCDFVLISVHLNPDEAVRRRQEFTAIWRWVAKERGAGKEQDFIVLGDTNLQNHEELLSDVPDGYVSLNDACVPTNVNLNGPRPYDHVIFDPSATSEIDRDFGFHVIDLIREMRSRWHHSAPYPGDPFQQNGFRFYYSDHNPVVFQMRMPDRDDD
jgi:endonuclease/exonuclease/phosphatase family metal-dependent hydrolase